MDQDLGERIYHRRMTRRDFLWLATVSTAGVLAGCATDPVTGKQTLVLMSERQEIELDKEHSPHQFSADYGAAQDQALNDYVSQVGKSMAERSHRPHMPYSFRAVNATYVNAYAFPGGSIAATRGILLSLEHEAELAGLLGHEIGHVNARHTAERMTKGLITSALVTGAMVYVQAAQKQYAPLAAGLGGIGAGMLLAHYSRDDEREADALGMEYMTRVGENPQGMVDLMDMLRNLSKRKPNAIEMMFATHPMSEERYQTAKQSAETTYSSKQDVPLNRERYMDQTVRLRKIKPAIEAMQDGEKEMAKKAYPEAESHFGRALKIAPRDYAGLVMMAKCQLAQNKHDLARQYAERAKKVYPEEAQAQHLSGVSKLMGNRFEAAYTDFDNYEKRLPGNPNTVFLKGVSLEGMQNKQAAAKEYYRYLQMVNQGDQAQYAYQRLVDWGFVGE
jgi:predicted Zn-dependent protease